MTYGSGIYIDEKNLGPDLIAAVGVDGARGYIRAEDRAVNTPPPANPAEAAKAEPRDYVIPLYAVDGKTVIGEFAIQAGQSGQKPGS